MEIITDNNWKYKVQLLETTSNEYKFVENIFKTHTTDSFFVNSDKFRFYKVVEQNAKRKNNEEKSNNLMLFHGTNKRGVHGILQNGFRNSKEGFYGQGVYMTEYVTTALMYSFTIFLKYCVFVNEVLESEKIKTEYVGSFSNLFLDDVPTPIKNPFTKYVIKSNVKSLDENYIQDPKGRKYRNVLADNPNCRDEFVADSKVVIPRYLMLYEVETSKLYLVFYPVFYLIFVFFFVIDKILTILFLPYTWVKGLMHTD